MTANTLVVGKAMYLEMRHGSYTSQIILTPEAATVAGKAVPMTCYRRKIHPTAPRKSWRQVSSGIMSAFDANTKTFAAMTMEHALVTVPDRMNFADNMFNQLITQGWKLHVQPITVEVTPEDLDDIRAGKTPYKILGRITRCRRTLNFGESLFAE